jgi:hypothetical protein
VTNLDDEIYRVLDDNLGDLACRLVQDDTKVVLPEVSVICTTQTSNAPWRAHYE